MQYHDQGAIVSMSQDEGQIQHIQNLTGSYTKIDIHDIAQGYQVGRNIDWPVASTNNGKFVWLEQEGINQTSDTPAMVLDLRININHGENDIERLFLLMENQIYDDFVDDTDDETGKGDENPPDTGSGG